MFENVSHYRSNLGLKTQLDNSHGWDYNQRIIKIMNGLKLISKKFTFKQLKDIVTYPKSLDYFTMD